MMAFNVDDELIARWTPAHEQIARHLLVKVLEVITPADSANPTLYRCQTNMGVTMLLPETDLAAPPPAGATAANPPETALAKP
jgi:hypothetical protein